MRGKDSGDLDVILGCLIGILALSIFSGYTAARVPTRFLFPYTPIGLLFRFDPQYLDYTSSCAFSGRFDLTFDYLKVFLTTCFLESPFYFTVLRSTPWRARLGVLILANACTHPAVFFLFPCLLRNFLIAILSSEAFALSSEIMIVLWIGSGNLKKGRPRMHPVLAAFAIVMANLFSWQVGIYF